MNNNELYMQRCLQLAKYGEKHTRPNPMVGAVIVHNGKIIGEGYHMQYGYAHAEVNAINSVKDMTLLEKSVMYVSLEPCSHYGKTPPCAKLIIEKKIPKVVIAIVDPDPQVSGRGVKMLKDSGIEVVVGILEKEAKILNKHFFTRQIKKRPYIYVKWAQTKDGYIDKLRKGGDPNVPTPISNNFTKILVHKKRTEVASIMIGTNTAINDNPQLTARLWYGENPLRVVLDRNLRIPETNNIFNGLVPTIIFTEKDTAHRSLNNTTYIRVNFDEKLLVTMMAKLAEFKIESILIEGGKLLLESFIKNELWDEAFIEIADLKFGEGTKAPFISGEIISDKRMYNTKMLHLANNKNYKLL